MGPLLAPHHLDTAEVLAVPPPKVFNLMVTIYPMSNGSDIFHSPQSPPITTIETEFLPSPFKCNPMKTFGKYEYEFCHPYYMYISLLYIFFFSNIIFYHLLQSFGKFF